MQVLVSYGKIFEFLYKMQWGLIRRLNMILFAILKYHSGYSLENGFLWEKSRKILGVWIRSDDDVSYSSGRDQREKRNSYTKYMSIRFLALKNGCSGYKNIGEDLRRAIVY